MGSEAFFRAAATAVVTGALAVVATASCGDDEAFETKADAGTDAPVTVATDAGVDAPPDAKPPPKVTFGACPGAFSGACATIDMPLDWSDPNGKKVGVLVDKISTTSSPKTQIWFLQGGPGGTAADMIGLARVFAQRLDDVEVMTIEHRGVGASNRLGCPVTEAMPPPDGGADAGVDPAAPLIACLEEAKTKYGPDLRFYTATNAARDLARAIELTRPPGAKVIVFGASYGTTWAQRFMQVAPTGADAVILDSVVAPGEQFLSDFDRQGDMVAKKIAEACKTNAACTAALGADPWSSILATKQRLDQGLACPELGMAPRDRALFTELLRPWPTMTYALAAWKRLDRCAPGDVAALRQLAKRFPLHGPNEALNSVVLQMNVMYSELWETPPPSAATMKQRFDDVVFPSGGDVVAAGYDMWPKYEKDAFVGKYPDAKIPVLIMNGTLDSQTPIELAEKVKTHYTAPNQTFVTVPNANHGVVGQSPMIATPGSAPESCGLLIALSFAKNPVAPPDTSCLAQLAPVSFDRPPEELAFVFGTTDLWVGAPAISADVPRSLVDVQRSSVVRLFGAR